MKIKHLRRLLGPYVGTEFRLIILIIIVQLALIYGVWSCIKKYRAYDRSINEIKQLDKKKEWLSKSKGTYLTFERHLEDLFLTGDKELIDSYYLGLISMLNQVSEVFHSDSLVDKKIFSQKELAK